MSASAVPGEVVTELDRIERRWHQLPLATAERCADRVRALVQHLAEAAIPDGKQLVPDLGPATLVDQLRVVLYDACAAEAVPASRLTEELVQLRRELP